MLKLIAKLYQVEREAKEKNLSPKELLAKRRRESIPVLRAIKANVDNWSMQAIPKSPLADAAGYVRNQWKSLIVYLRHPEVELDNNSAERQMRAVALDRNNWMFVASEDGTHCAALFFSLINICRLNHINPLRYLTAVLPSLKPKQNPDYAALTPVAWARSQK